MLRSGTGHPERCVFLKKKTDVSRSDFWECEYDDEFKTCLTPVNLPKPTIQRNSPRERSTAQTTRRPTQHASTVDTALEIPPDETLRALSETEEYTDDDRPGDLDFWFRDVGDCVFRSKRMGPSAENVERARFHPGEIATLYGMVSDVADESKYYLTVNSITSVLTVTWKQSERGLHWGEFLESRHIIDDARGKKCHASSSSSLSVHSYNECVIRAKRWCVWHSSWIYDVRPIVLLIRTNVAICYRYAII